ncbi:hypothetical protein NP233_g5356 [Leucocoprinus birnbaumii]|uniref:Flavin reductase like domain-containing protein n=1 Tax=Leucocoprinus birnbaumii TaxID=56174 RepID=A0AAD5VT21_9AGAR|nr:hypothetical protein NP233_g5356 [Leucocoprinus birnbaumii]
MLPRISQRSLHISFLTRRYSQVATAASVAAKPASQPQPQQIPHAQQQSQKCIREQLRELLRETAQPVAVVTAFMPPSSPHSTPSTKALHHGATLSSFTSIAMDPYPLVTFALRIPSRMANTLNLAADSAATHNTPAQMVISILSSTQAKHALVFSRPDLYPTPFTDPDIPYTLSEEGLPVLEGSLGAMSCRLVGRGLPLHDMNALIRASDPGMEYTGAQSYWDENSRSSPLPGRDSTTMTKGAVVSELFIAQAEIHLVYPPASRVSIITFSHLRPHLNVNGHPTLPPFLQLMHHHLLILRLMLRVPEEKKILSQINLLTFLLSKPSSRPNRPKEGSIPPLSVHTHIQPNTGHEEKQSSLKLNISAPLTDISPSPIRSSKLDAAIITTSTEPSSSPHTLTNQHLRGSFASTRQGDEAPTTSERKVQFIEPEVHHTRRRSRAATSASTTPFSSFPSTSPSPFTFPFSTSPAHTTTTTSLNRPTTFIRSRSTTHPPLRSSPTKNTLSQQPQQQQRKVGRVSKSSGKLYFVNEPVKDHPYSKRKAGKEWKWRVF